MIRTSRQLKDLIRNLSKESGIESEVLLRKYMMERFLERLSKSNYVEHFILKGGMLVSAFVGVESRATMDMDATIKGISMSITGMSKIILEIFDIPLDDNVVFKMKKVTEIMDESEYSGIRFSVDAFLDRAVIPLKIDISTGDLITPKEMKYEYKLMFEDRNILILAYPIETVLAEKLETVVSRSITNTRMRDFYDIHRLLESQRVDCEILKVALKRTASKRGSLKLMKNAETVLRALESDEKMAELWERYRNKYHYAKEYPWKVVMCSVRCLSLKAGLYSEWPG